MLSFNLKKLNHDDGLWLFRLICMDIFRNKPSKLLLQFLIYIIVIINIIQSILFIQISEKAYLIKYLPSYCCSFLVLVAIYSIPRIAEALSTNLEKLDFWKINTADSTIEQKIKLETLYWNAFIIVNTSVSFISAILHSMPLDDDKEIFYTLALIEDFLPLWKNWFYFVYRTSFLILPLVVGAPFYMTIYFCCQIRFQAYMLFHLIENFDKSNICQHSDDNYQKEVKRMLILCVQKHCRLKCTGQKLLKKFSSFVFLFIVTGTVAIISIIFFLISFEGSFKERYLRIITMVIPSVLIFIHVNISGQMIEDITNRAFEEILKSMDWSDWNKENKNIYLIFLANNQKPFKVQFSESICVNYKLALSILKSVYSVVSVLGYIK